MTPRIVTRQDAAEISALVISSAENAKADFSDDSWQTFLQMNDQQAMLQRINDPQTLIYCVERNSKLAGMISMHDLQKIELMFVLSEFTKQGIARLLWQHVRKKCEDQGNHFFWARSSSNAIPVYQSFGFESRGAPSSSYGITFQLMELEIDKQ